MIQKRYKQTEKLAQAQGLKQMLENLPVILAEIPLPDILKMPDYRQVLRVRDINVAICANFVGLTPKRILIDKESGEEVDMNLPVPKWEITGSNFSSIVNPQGVREMHEMEWYDDELDEVVTTKPVVTGLDENGDPIYEEQELEPLIDESFLLPSIPYLMFMVKQVKLPVLIEMFSHQFVADNTEIWNKIK